MPPQSPYENGAYLAANPDWHMEDSPWKAQQIGDLLTATQMPFQTAVEVGCGAGLILQDLAKRFPDKDWRGFDVSADAGRFWANWADGPVTYAQADFLAGAARADLILLIDVFEHVEDYLGFLERLRARADRFVFHIPLDMNVQGLMRGSMLRSRQKVGHLHYFSKPTALATLADAGYEIVAWRFTAASSHGGRQGRPLRTRLANLPRRLLFPLAPETTAMLMGGYSLLVLARPAD